MAPKTKRRYTAKDITDILVKAGFGNDPIIFHLVNFDDDEPLIDPAKVPPLPQPKPQPTPYLQAGGTHFCLKLPPWGADDVVMYLDDIVAPPVGAEVEIEYPEGEVTHMVVQKVKLATELWPNNNTGKPAVQSFVVVSVVKK